MSNSDTQTDFASFGVDVPEPTVKNTDSNTDTANQPDLIVKTTDSANQPELTKEGAALKEKLEQKDYTPENDGHYPDASPTALCKYYDLVKYTTLSEMSPPIGRVSIILRPDDIVHKQPLEMGQKWEGQQGVYLKHSSGNYGPPDPTAASDHLLMLLCEQMLRAADRFVGEDDYVTSVSTSAIGPTIIVHLDDDIPSEEQWAFSSRNGNVSTIPKNPNRIETVEGFTSVRKLGNNNEYKLAAEPRLSLESITEHIESPLVDRALNKAN